MANRYEYRVYICLYDSTCIINRKLDNLKLYFVLLLVLKRICLVSRLQRTSVISIEFYSTLSHAFWEIVSVKHV